MTSDGAGGVRLRIPSKMTADVVPPNGSVPVAISYSTTPNENKSVRASRISPRACSGDMQATVPTVLPGLVIALTQYLWSRYREAGYEQRKRALRLKAVELLGPMGSEKTGAGLSALYDNEKDRNIRKKIIESLFVQGNAKALVAIAKTEKDPQLKKKAIEQLSVMNSKEGTELFEEMLNK